MSTRRQQRQRAGAEVTSRLPRASSLHCAGPPEQYHKSKCCDCSPYFQVHLTFLSLKFRSRQTSEQCELEPQQTVVVECIRRSVSASLDQRQLRARYYPGNNPSAFARFWHDSQAFRVSSLFATCPTLSSKKTLSHLHKLFYHP